MVKDHRVAVTAPCGVSIIIVRTVRPLIPETTANIADDDVVITGVQRPVGNADAVPRCGLSGDGNIGIPHVQIGCQVDRSGYLKDNRAGGIMIQGITQRTGTGVIEIGDNIDGPAAAAGGSGKAGTAQRKVGIKVNKTTATKKILFTLIRIDLFEIRKSFFCDFSLQHNPHRVDDKKKLIPPLHPANICEASSNEPYLTPYFLESKITLLSGQYHLLATEYYSKKVILGATLCCFSTDMRNFIFSSAQKRFLDKLHSGMSYWGWCAAQKNDSDAIFFVENKDKRGWD